MLSELCRELKNWFEQAKYIGRIEIKDGQITSFNDGIVVQENQYFRIVGSVFNDGVYQYPSNDLTDEVFDGAIWLLAIPQEILTLSSEIDAWKAKYATPDAQSMSPFASESFGGYSYSKATGSNGTTTSGAWQNAFASRLTKWRKI